MTPEQKYKAKQKAQPSNAVRGNVLKGRARRWSKRLRRASTKEGRDAARTDRPIHQINMGLKFDQERVRKQSVPNWLLRLLGPVNPKKKDTHE